MDREKGIIDRLFDSSDASDEELRLLLEADASIDAYLFQRADEIRQKIYGKEVYLRGLIEFTNHCKNNCYYCGIRCGNRELERYRLSKEEILECCREGYALGYRTFVLQGGEDPYYTDEMICDIVSSIHGLYPDCAITLSVGEKEKSSYQAYFDAGARRYLLRHETANDAHYRQLHPSVMSSAHRQQCLFDLKEIGYQVGTGIMVGSPFQTTEDILEDIRFMQKLDPDMIGIGPYLTHPDTPFADQQNGSLDTTLRLLALFRLMFPYVLLPATTALGTIHPKGRELGLKAGANVVMPNLSPTAFRELYSLYENKICTGDEAAQCRNCLERRVQGVGYEIVTSVGDCAKFRK
ncbi:MAG: [FeFe] hydrogenase H-cluster radical SAM maturase HydE [Lachnospiraceae bacterium]|nr:[FeFe] hydrogenase H-cluster radical SAM maturase HydE [Lachnospiraceae bacterium]